MAWTETAVVGAGSDLAVIALMWRGEWLQDAEGRWEVNGYHLGFVVLAVLGGSLSGALLGVIAGFAVVAAAVNIPVGMLLAWGLAGGDGEADSPVAGLLSMVVFLGCIAAFVVALRAGAEPTRRDVLLCAIPSLALIAAMPFTRPPNRLKTALYGGGILAVPALLLTAA